MKTIEKNKLIAEFMGYALNNKDQYCTEKGNIEDYLLEFHTSWDWLKPVIDKIFTLKFNEVKGLKEYTDRQNTIFDHFICGIHSSIDHIYIKVVEFIEWYNQNKEQ